MPEAGLDSVFAATNQAVEDLERKSRTLLRQIEESKASLASLSKDREKAMADLEFSKNEKDKLSDSIKDAWDVHGTKVSDSLDHLQAQSLSLDERETALDAREKALNEKERQVGELVAKYAELKGNTYTKAQEAKKQIISLLDGLSGE